MTEESLAREASGWYPHAGLVPRQDARKVDINAVAGRAGKTAAMKFHVVKVQRPLASAVKVVEAGNRIVTAKGEAYTENEANGDRMPMRIERGTFVFDVQYQGARRARSHWTAVPESMCGPRTSCRSFRWDRLKQDCA